MEARARRATITRLLVVLRFGFLLPLLVALGARAPLGAQAAAAGAILVDGIIYVDGDATGAGDGTSWDDAFTGLQDALGAATSGDEIWVAEGTYLPTVEHGGSGDRYRSFQLLNGVALYGGFDPSVGDIGWEDRDWVNNVTIASGDIGVVGDPSDNCYHVFYHPFPHGTNLDGSAILDGFTVSGGNADGDGYDNYGAGMFNVLSSPTLANCTFEGNAATGFPGRGGGMYNDRSSPTLSSCTFSGNSAYYYGGAMYNDSSSPTLTSCTFQGNWVSKSGGAVYNFNNSSPSLANCTFEGNSAGDDGGGIYNELSSPSLTNCTFAGNSAGDYGGAMRNHQSTPTLANCILWGNAPDEMYSLYGSPVVTYSDIQGGHPGDHNIDADPLFVDPENGDLHLQACSPAIDAGDNDAPNLPSNDFEGDDRIINGTVDMGVDEADFDPPITHSLVLTSTEGGSVTEPGEGTFSVGCGRVFFLTATADVGYRFLHWTGDPVNDPNSPSTFIAMDGDKTVTAHFGAGSVVYVDIDATGANTGASWEHAYTDLQDGLEAAGGEEIWVAEGTYLPAQEHGGSGERYRSFQMRNGLALYGGFDPSVGDVEWQDRDWANNVTILSGDIGTVGDPADNSYHVLHHPYGTDLDSSAILDGFTVTSGNADGGVFQDYGGGMYNRNSSPTVTNCTFSHNRAVQGGGGMYNRESSPALTNCTFEDNSAIGYEALGAGMYNQSSSPALINCTFSRNSASWGGGGMFNGEFSSPTLTNCTFSGNSAPSGGAMYGFRSLLSLTNCTFSGNEASSQGGAMYNSSTSAVLTNCILWGDSPDELFGDSPTVSHSDIQGAVLPGQGNIKVDPQFVNAANGDYHLQPSSPCIDAGDNAAPNLPLYDFDGDDRIVDGDGDGTATVDMGADEVALPIAGLEVSNNSPTPVGRRTTLTAVVSTGSNVAYSWAFGDGEIGSGPVVGHIYPAADTYTAVVTASNSVSQLTDTTTVRIFEPQGTIYLPLALRNAP